MATPEAGPHEAGHAEAVAEEPALSLLLLPDDTICVDDRNAAALDPEVRRAGARAMSRAVRARSSTGSPSTTSRWESAVRDWWWRMPFRVRARGGPSLVRCTSGAG
ncbi:MAG TPA: hypothetical protein VFQ17_12340 [Nocardioides sp.]|nr:hypothetical protein [Nocardioides sp.]